jgi:hypothetical protein
MKKGHLLAHYYAALGPVRIVREVPELEENFMGLATSLLNAKHHGVLYLQFSSAGIYIKIAKMQFSSTEVRTKKEVRTFFYFSRSCLPIIRLRE